MKQIIKNWLIPPGYFYLLSQLLSREKKLSAADKLCLDKIKPLKNKYNNKRCFILGGGSSINQQDLSQLAGEHVHSVSNTFVHPEFETTAPQFHVLPPLLASHSNYYEDDRWTDWLKQMDEKIGGASIILHIGDQQLIEKNQVFENNDIYWVEYEKWDENEVIRSIEPHKIPAIWSVSEAAISMALFLGYEKIYLLGFDHDWFNGPLVYFYDEKKDHALKPTIENLTHVDAEFQMRRHAKIFRKYKNLYALKNNIFNANANQKHYMDVFPKVEFDSLF